MRLKFRTLCRISTSNFYLENILVFFCRARQITHQEIVTFKKLKKNLINFGELYTK